MTPPNHRPYQGYAYQLAECTEIILREVLLRILNEQRLFDTFADARMLDEFFAAGQS